MANARQVIDEEVARFSALAPRWWDPDGPMRPLHRMNGLRVGWITQRILARLGTGVSLLDIGCGAGLASEALAREGFEVTGLDASADAISVARGHAAGAGLPITYQVGLAEDALQRGERFSAVTALEIIEHVPDHAAFMRSLAGLLLPGGMLFVSTINRSLRSLAVAKIGAEYVARLLPAGTHDWRKFVKPDELGALGRGAGLALMDVSGMTYSLASGTWHASQDVSINYIASFVSD